MKIMMLYNKSDFAYNFTREIIEKFISENHEIVMVFPDNEYEEEFIKMGCKVLKIKMNRRGMNVFKDYGLYIQYKKIFRKYSPDIIFGFTIKPNIYGAQAAKKNKIPFVARISGLGSMFQRNDYAFKLVKTLYKVSFSKISYIYFENNENYIKFNEKVRKYENSKVIPGSGVNTEYFSYQEYPKIKSPIKFLFIGRIMYEKGIDDFLIVAEILKKKYQEKIEFHIVGMYEENYEGRIEDLVSKNIIVYHGKIRSVKVLIGESHCIVLPSHHEGLSNAMLEALSTGRPVIGSDISGIRETFEDNRSGLLIKPKNPEDLLEKIEMFYNFSQDIKIEMGKLGREKIIKEFDRKIVIDEYMSRLKIIREIGGE